MHNTVWWTRGKLPWWKSNRHWPGVLFFSTPPATHLPSLQHSTKKTVTMRPTTALIHLSLLTPAALCSPIPFVLVGDLEAVSGAAHPPAPVAASRPEHALPKIIVFELEEEEDGQEAPIDNRPVTPSATAQPSVVLASPRPITTEYLLSLAHHPWMRRKGGGGGSKLSKLPAQAVAAVESSSITQMEMGVEVSVPVGRTGMPCYYARLGRGHNDVLAVSLIIIFVAVVVAVETFSR